MWYFSANELMACPSHRKGIPHETIDVYRFKGCELIEKLASIFRLPKLSTASAKVFFHRFFALQSFDVYDTWLIAATCLFLAAKVEEHYMKAVDYSKHYMAQRKKLCHEARPTDVVHPKATTKAHTVESQTEELLFTECIVLHVLAYDLNVVHPYTFINEFVELALPCIKKTLDDDEAVTLKRGAWSFLNDSSNTNLCLRFEPRVIAAVAVYLAGCYFSLWAAKFDDDDSETAMAAWWHQINIPKPLFIDASRALLDTYNKGYAYKKKPLPDGIVLLLQALGNVNAGSSE